MEHHHHHHLFSKHHHHREEQDPDYVYDEHISDDATQTKRVILKSLISQVLTGVPFHKLDFPIAAWDGTSFLERLSRFYISSPSMAMKIINAPDSMSRLFGVLQFYLSGWHTFPMDIKRPFIPLQGEVFRCDFVDSSGTKVHYLAEQLGAHPAASAFCIWLAEHRMYLDGVMVPHVRHGINTVETVLEGTISAKLLDWNESYTLNYPSISLSGVMWGKMALTIKGDVTISSPETGIKVNLQFRKGKQIRGSILAPNGYTTLYNIYGHWCSVIYIEDCNTKAVRKLFDVADTHPSQKIVPPESQQQPYESQQIWKDVNNYMKQGNEELFFQAKKNVQHRPPLSLTPITFEKDPATNRWQMKNLDSAFAPRAPSTTDQMTTQQYATTTYSTTYTTVPSTTAPTTTVSYQPGYTTYVRKY